MPTTPDGPAVVFYAVVALHDDGNEKIDNDLHVHKYTRPNTHAQVRRYVHACNIVGMRLCARAGACSRTHASMVTTIATRIM